MTFANQPGSRRLDSTTQPFLEAWKASGARWLAISLLCAGCAASTPPGPLGPSVKGFAKASSFTGPPLACVRTEPGGIAVYWTAPGTNVIWLAEWSTNLIDWHYCGNETVYWIDGFRFTETSPAANANWFVRLRKQ